MTEKGRIARFVKAARNLLLMQLAAALLALLLALWAVTAVWELAAERDRLREQVQALQSRQPAAPAEAVPTTNPLTNEVRTPAILPIAIPVPEVPAEVNTILPEGNVTVPTINQVAEPTGPTPAGEPDCTGANAGLPRCRPTRWNVRQRPEPRTGPEPQPPTSGEAPPRGD